MVRLDQSINYIHRVVDSRLYFAYDLVMGGERCSTTRMRLAGNVCSLCGCHLDAMLWQPPGERVCEACEAKHFPAPKLRRIHMSFVLGERWHCTFMEEDLRTPAALGHTLQAQKIWSK
jgi:hypothetical protein